MKQRSPNLTQRNFKEHKKERIEELFTGQKIEMPWWYFFSRGCLKLQEPEGKSKKSWIKAKTEKDLS